MNPVKRVRTAIFLLLAATFPAAAQEATPAAATEAAAADGDAPPAETDTLPAAQATQPSASLSTSSSSALGPSAGRTPWSGSTVTYGHAATAYTLRRDGEPLYNPTWGHRLELRPVWHFGDHLYLSGQFELAQELTLSDVTTYPNEIVWSDVFMDVGASGFEIPVAKIRVGGSVRLTVGTSRSSAAETKRFSVGPGLSVARRFDVLLGLDVGYAARYTLRNHRYTTRQNIGPVIAASCFDPQSLECAVNSQQGTRNTQSDLLHGATVSFFPHERVSVVAAFNFAHGRKYPLARSDKEDLIRETIPDDPTTEAWGATFSVGFQVLPELGVGLSSSTFSVQTTPDRTAHYNPLFNRFTNLSLDLSLDVEALTARF